MAVVNEAQQGPEHRIPVVRPLAEEDAKVMLEGSPAEHGQWEGGRPVGGEAAVREGAAEPHGVGAGPTHLRSCPAVP